MYLRCLLTIALAIAGWSAAYGQDSGVLVQPADKNLTDITKLKCAEGTVLTWRGGKWTCPLPSEPVLPPITGAGTGTIVIETVGENTSDPVGSAPYAVVWVDGLPPSVRTATVADLPTGNHTAHAEVRHGLVQSVATCTYPEGEEGCTATDFTDIPEADCNLTNCTTPIDVTAGRVRKVIFKHRGVYEGWGKNTIGGRDGSLLTVTNLKPSGPGSLRQALLDACQANNRYIVFAVSGTIQIPYTQTSGNNNNLKVCGNQITVDGFTAPPPGVTVTQYGLNIHITGPGGINDPKDTRDLILRGFRLRKGDFRGANCDGSGNDDCEEQVINMETGSSQYTGPLRVHDVVIDHMSISGGIDDQIGPSRGNYNVTISWTYTSAAGAYNQGYLQADRSYQFSLHHNRWTQNARRNPQTTYHSGNPGTTDTSVPPTISADVRLNTMVAYKDQAAASHWGLLVASGAKANGIKNYFTNDSTLAGDSYGLNNAIIICNPGSRWLNPATMNTCGFCSGFDPCRRSSDVFLDGNVFVPKYGLPPPAINMNNLDVNVSSAIASPPITEEATATLGACAVRQKGGFRPLDAHDRAQEALYADPCAGTRK